jgi:hypothetical protein
MTQQYTCTVGMAVPAADATEDAHSPVIYISLTDQGGAFNDRVFFAADATKDEMLAVALTAISLNNRPVYAEVDPPNPGGVPYTQTYRLYLTTI